MKLEHILRHAKLTLLDQPKETIADIVEIPNLPNYKIYLKLMIDGKPSRPFSDYSWKDNQSSE